MDIGYREAVLRSTPARVLTVLVVAVCVSVAVAVAVAQPGSLLRALPALGLVSVGSWALFWAPAVTVGPAQVVLTNPLRSIEVVWPAIEDVRTRWGLELVTADGLYRAWAAPRSGAIGAGRAARLEVRRRSIGASAGEPPITDAALAAGAVVLRQWQEYREAGLLGAVEGAGVVVRWHGRTTVALGLLAVATAAAAFAG